MNAPTLGEVLQSLTGLSLGFSWWSPWRAFPDSATLRVANLFNASKERVRNKHCIIDTEDQAWQDLTSLKGEIRRCWVDGTMPYVVPGVRLCPIRGLGELRDKLADYGERVSEATSRLDMRRRSLRDRCERQLGDLFLSAEFPESFYGLFAFQMEERSIEPPTYLMHSNAEEYARQIQARVADVQSGMNQFQGEIFQELGKLTRRLCEITQEAEQGQRRPKIGDANILGFRRLFDRVARLNFAGTEVFQAVLQDAKRLVEGVSPEELRREQGLRAETHREAKAMVARFQELRQGMDVLADDTDDLTVAG